jgi:transposase-like protein
LPDAPRHVRGLRLPVRAQHQVAHCAQPRTQGQADAAHCLKRDWDDFITFDDLPQEHWIHLRTSNPIESIFGAVRLRTDATKPIRVRDNVLHLLLKLAFRLRTNWRGINAPTRSLCSWPDTTSWMGTSNFPNRHRRKLPP